MYISITDTSLIHYSTVNSLSVLKVIHSSQFSPPSLCTIWRPPREEYKPVLSQHLMFISHGLDSMSLCHGIVKQLPKFFQNNKN